MKNLISPTTAAQLLLEDQDDSALPVGSALPNQNTARKLNVLIEKSTAKKQSQAIDPSPLTALNQREKQFKKKTFLKATYGKDYQKSRDQILKENREIKDTLADIGFSKPGAIPDSYLFQSESNSRVWLEKHGRANMVFSQE